MTLDSAEAPMLSKSTRVETSKFRENLRRSLGKRLTGLIFPNQALAASLSGLAEARRFLKWDTMKAPTESTGGKLSYMILEL